MRNLTCECEPSNESGAARVEREVHKNNSRAKKSNGIVLTPLPSVVRPLFVRRPSFVRPCGTKAFRHKFFLISPPILRALKKGDKKFSKMKTGERKLRTYVKQLRSVEKSNA